MPKAAQNVLYPKEQDGNIIVKHAESSNHKRLFLRCMPKAVQNVLFKKEQKGNIVVTLAKSMPNPYA
jgi:hypothetical protein